MDPGPTPLPPESKGNGLRLAGEPPLARIRTHGRVRPRPARRAVDDTAPEKESISTFGGESFSCCRYQSSPPGSKHPSHVPDAQIDNRPKVPATAGRANLVHVH